MIDTKRIREAFSDEVQRTHWDGCIYENWHCALLALCDALDDARPIEAGRLLRENQELRAEIANPGLGQAGLLNRIDYLERANEDLERICLDLQAKNKELRLALGVTALDDEVRCPWCSPPLDFRHVGRVSECANHRGRMARVSPSNPCGSPAWDEPGRHDCGEDTCVCGDDHE